MSMKKTQDIKLETTASYQPLSDLNVRLWSQDKNTAELRFIVTRNQFPLSLSKENVKVIIALESGSSFISSDELIIDSEIEGVARYIIPTDFMKVASNVIGQVYVTTLDGEEVIVERQFKFTVSNDLLSEYPSEDKLRYIKTFDDLRTEIASRVSKLEVDMENMEDYIVQVQDTTQSGITSLTKLINDKEKEYNDNHTAKMQELEEKGTTYSQQLDDDKQYMDEKFEAFQESVNGSGLVTTGQSKDWQKYKLTSDDGTYSLIDLQNKTENYYGLKTGVYYTTNTPHGISGVSTAGFSEMKIKQGTTVKRLTFRPDNSNRIFEKWFYNEWSDWYELVTSKDVSQIETTQGAQNKANTAENNAKQYTDEKYSKRNKILFEGTASGVGTAINLDEDLDNFIMLYIIGDFPGGEFSALGNPIGTRNININIDNVVGLDATDATSFECTLKKVNRQKLEINSDNYVNILTGEGSGANANKFTIQKIIGVYK